MSDLSEAEETMCAICIVSPKAAGDLADNAEAGDEEASVWAGGIGDWLERVVESREPWGCLGCDAVFKGISEIGVFVSVKPPEKYRRVLTGCVCLRCVESGKDLEQIATESVPLAKATLLRKFN